MTPEEIGKLKTPLTETVRDGYYPSYDEGAKLIVHARRLEQNQAALMEALVLALPYVAKRDEQVAAKLRETLAAVRSWE